MTTTSYLEAVRQTLASEMRRDSSVVVMGEGIGLYGGVYGQTKGLFDEFGPTRLIDTPISESAWCGAGLGLAMAGYRPVLDLMYVDFAAVAFDQIANQIANLRYMTGGQWSVPLVIRASMGAIRSSGVQHSETWAPLFMHIPGLQVVLPSSPHDLVGLLRASIRGSNPTIFLEHKWLYNTKGEVPDDDYVIPLGVGEVKRPGTDVTVVATSKMVVLALQAAEELSRDGISVEVLDPRTLVPLDTALVKESVKRTGRLVVFDESHLTCGVGAEIAALVLESDLGALRGPVRRVQTLDMPIPFSPTLEARILPNVDRLITAVRDVVGATPVASS